MSNFRLRLGETVKILATGENDVKSRLQVACEEHFLLATLYGKKGIPDYFIGKWEDIFKKLSAKEWTVGNVKEDRLRATLYRMHKTTASRIAKEIWVLYTEYEEYMHGNFIIPMEHSRTRRRRSRIKA